MVTSINNKLATRKCEIIAQLNRKQEIRSFVQSSKLTNRTILVALAEHFRDFTGTVNTIDIFAIHTR